MISWQIDGGKVETVTIFLASKISAICDCSHRIKRCLFLERKAMTKVDSILKSRDIILLTKVHIVKAMFFSSSHVLMWESDHKEGWALKNQCFQTAVLEKTLEGPLDSKGIKPVNPKGNPSWIFIEMTDAETPIFWPPDVKSWLIGKVPEAWKVWGQEEKRATEDEMVSWHHQLNGHKFQQTLGYSEEQGGLTFCSP